MLLIKIFEGVQKYIKLLFELHKWLMKGIYEAERRNENR